MSATESQAHEKTAAPSLVITTGAGIVRPDDDEAAAALAAVAYYLAEQEALAAQQLGTLNEDWRWKASQVLLNQRTMPARVPQRPRWDTIDRLRRSGYGMAGITGML
jgi:hypothetical protein